MRQLRRDEFLTPEGIKRKDVYEKHYLPVDCVSCGKKLYFMPNYNGPGYRNYVYYAFRQGRYNHGSTKFCNECFMDDVKRKAGLRIARGDK